MTARTPRKARSAGNMGEIGLGLKPCSKTPTMASKSLQNPGKSALKEKTRRSDLGCAERRTGGFGKIDSHVHMEISADRAASPENEGFQRRIVSKRFPYRGGDFCEGYGNLFPSSNAVARAGPFRVYTTSLKLIAAIYYTQGFRLRTAWRSLTFH